MRQFSLRGACAIWKLVGLDTPSAAGALFKRVTLVKSMKRGKYLSRLIDISIRIVHVSNEVITQQTVRRRAPSVAKPKLSQVRAYWRQAARQLRCRSGQDRGDALCRFRFGYARRSWKNSGALPETTPAGAAVLAMQAPSDGGLELH